MVAAAVKKTTPAKKADHPTVSTHQHIIIIS